MISAGLALIAATALYATMRWQGTWRPGYLMAGAVLYLGFGLYLVAR